MSLDDCGPELRSLSIYGLVLVYVASFGVMFDVHIDVGIALLDIGLCFFTNDDMELMK